MSRIIVALSGGKASAWCADWALRTYPRDDVILYFNDTKWEHPDLYRFLEDLERYFERGIVYDSDGRSPEELFYKHRALANNRMPFCSRELKAERMQAFYRDGDVLVFGIGGGEVHRADRIFAVYGRVGERTGRWAELVFPLIDLEVSGREVDAFLVRAGIEPPLLYRLGFLHNNCSGGCVRAGKKQWKMLYEKLPEVYMERERVENEVRAWLGKDVHFFKDETLTDFRGRIERGELGKYYADTIESKQISMWDDDVFQGECIGICETMN